jgi:hypothetical protein
MEFSLIRQNFAVCNDHISKFGLIDTQMYKTKKLWLIDSSRPGVGRQVGSSRCLTITAIAANHNYKMTISNAAVDLLLCLKGRLTNLVKKI